MADDSIVIDGAEIDFSDTGSGRTVVFVHGAYVTGSVWADVTSRLLEDFRCITPTWPLGAHRPISSAGTDLGATAAMRRIVHFVEALDLRDVTLVANDTGGGLVLAALGDPALDTGRISRLVLTNCDSYEHFPPAGFAGIVKLCRRSALAGRVVLRLLATTAGQRYFLNSVCERPPGKHRRREIFGYFASSETTRREAVELTASLNPALTLRAAKAIEVFDRPVHIVWGTKDKLFPLDHAKRLASAFPHSTLVDVAGSSTYVMIDAPQALADVIRAA